MGVNTDRLWFVTAQMVGDSNWSAKSGTLAGCLITDPANLVRLVEVMDSDTRDVLVVCPKAVMIVQPKSTQKLGLIAGFRAMRGNTRTLGDTYSLAKSDIVAIDVLDSIPRSAMTGMPCARITTRDGAGTREVLFAIDVATNAIGGFAENARDWLKSSS